MAVSDRENGVSGSLVVVGRGGSARIVYDMEDGLGIAMFSRAEDWVVFQGPDGVTLIPSDGDPVHLGEILPREHWVLAAG